MVDHITISKNSYLLIDLDVNLVPLSVTAKGGEDLWKYSTVIGCCGKWDKIDIEVDS